MIQDLHTEIDRLKRRIKLCERITLGSLVGICVSVKFGHQEWIGLLFLILFARSLSWFSSGNSNKKSIW